MKESKSVRSLKMAMAESEREKADVRRGEGDE
jgi:hypothetical protein